MIRATGWVARENGLPQTQDPPYGRFVTCHPSKGVSGRPL
jgi:hypothetical protein